jgi:hypothetical protein
MRCFPGLMIVLLLAACAAPPSQRAVPAGQPAFAAPMPPSPTPAADASSPQASCPITRRPDPPFTPPAPYAAESPVAGTFWYGDASLWTRLPDDGTWTVPAGMGEKVFWWREGFRMTDENQPALSMSGRRLDGPAAAVEASPATNGFHEDYGEFMLLGLSIPAGGCWELTGAYHGHGLSFVVWVAP